MQNADTDQAYPLPGVLIVVGAHLLAEIDDRPIAGKLRETCMGMINQDAGQSVVICTDLWYLNNDALRSVATISLGRPERNALGAYLAQRLPSILTVEDRFVVQMDPMLTDLIASCWGVDRRGTQDAVEAFAQEHLVRFLEAALPAGMA